MAPRLRATARRPARIRRGPALCARSFGLEAASRAHTPRQGPGPDGKGLGRSAVEKARAGFVPGMRRAKDRPPPLRTRASWGRGAAFPLKRSACTRKRRFAARPRSRFRSARVHTAVRWFPVCRRTGAEKGRMSADGMTRLGADRRRPIHRSEGPALQSARQAAFSFRNASCAPRGGRPSPGKSDAKGGARPGASFAMTTAAGYARQDGPGWNVLRVDGGLCMGWSRPLCGIERLARGRRALTKPPDRMRDMGRAGRRGMKI
mgnify:CR=1 FL=1